MVDWERITKEHGPLVWRTVYRLLGGRGGDAADCFQETFVSVLDVSRRQVVRNWPGLLQRVATARALDVLRRRKRNTIVRRDEVELDQVVSREREPSQRMQQAELQERLREALTQLPPAQSEVFCLRHLNDMRYDEIATEMEMSVDNVGVTLHRAKARLRELLTQDSPMKVPGENHV
jgi:RNA polymerase sigma-70 factor, ECF subfamily